MVQYMNVWCSAEQYEDFMARVLDWESAQDVRIIKLWLSISEEEQAVRIGRRKSSPLTSWKFSPNDALALSKYDQMTILKERVFTTLGEWHTIDYNNKAEGRLALMTKIVEI